MMTEKMEEEIRGKVRSLLENFKKLIKDKEFFDAISYGTNSKKTVQTRFNLAGATIEKVMKK